MYRCKYRSKFYTYVGITSFIDAATFTLSSDSLLNAAGITLSAGETLTRNYIGKDLLNGIGVLAANNKMTKHISKHWSAGHVPIAAITMGSILELTTEISPTHFMQIAIPASLIKSVGFAGQGIVANKLMYSKDPDEYMEMSSKNIVINTLGSTMGTMTGLCILGLAPSITAKLTFIMMAGGIKNILYSWISDAKKQTEHVIA